MSLQISIAGVYEQVSIPQWTPVGGGASHLGFGGKVIEIENRKEIYPITAPEIKIII
jgi:hypothetical protein